MVLLNCIVFLKYTVHPVYMNECRDYNVDIMKVGFFAELLY